MEARDEASLLDVQQLRNGERRLLSITDEAFEIKTCEL